MRYLHFLTKSSKLGGFFLILIGQFNLGTKLSSSNVYLDYVKFTVGKVYLYSQVFPNMIQGFPITGVSF